MPFLNYSLLALSVCITLNEWPVHLCSLIQCPASCGSLCAGLWQLNVCRLPLTLASVSDRVEIVGNIFFSGIYVNGQQSQFY